MIQSCWRRVGVEARQRVIPKAAFNYENSQKLLVSNDFIVLKDEASAQPAKRIISQLIRPFINTVQS